MHYLVVGRQHGDDEATAWAVEADSKEDAIHDFKYCNFLTASQMDELATIEAAGSDAESEGRYDLLVYIDSVWQADADIVPAP